MEQGKKQVLSVQGFGTKEVVELLKKELRETDTATAVWQLPNMTQLTRDMPLRPSSGLVDWYRRLKNLPHG